MAQIIARTVIRIFTDAVHMPNALSTRPSGRCTPPHKVVQCVRVQRCGFSSPRLPRRCSFFPRFPFIPPLSSVRSPVPTTSRARLSCSSDANPAPFLLLSRYHALSHAPARVPSRMPILRATAATALSSSMPPFITPAEHTESSSPTMPTPPRSLATHNCPRKNMPSDIGTVPSGRRKNTYAPLHSVRSIGLPCVRVRHRQRGATTRARTIARRRAGETAARSAPRKPVAARGGQTGVPSSELRGNRGNPGRREHTTRECRLPMTMR